MTECAHCGMEMPDDMLSDCTNCSSPICSACADRCICDIEMGPTMEDDRRENPREVPIE